MALRTARLATATVLLPAILTATASAQQLVAWDGMIQIYVEAPAMSPGWPNGGPPGLPFPGTGTLMPTPPGAIPGDSTIDNTTGIIYSTDGLTIEAINDPAYPPLAPAPAPFPKPAILGGILTGLAFDPAGAPGGVLYCTDGLSFVGISPLPPHNIVVFLFGINGVPGGITGLDWDPYAGMLVGVDALGGLWFIPPGVSGTPFPIGGPPVPLPFPVTDVALDRTLGPAPGPGLYVAAAGIIFNITGGPGIPPGAPLPLPAFAMGLAFHLASASLGGAASCSAGGSAPTLAANGATWTGNPGYALTFSNAPPGALAVLLAEPVMSNALVPGGLPFGQGGALYVDPFLSPTAIIVPIGTTGAGGSFTLTAPLTGAPPLLKIIVQFAVVCGGPPWFGLSNAVQVFTGLP